METTEYPKSSWYSQVMEWFNNDLHIANSPPFRYCTPPKWWKEQAIVGISVAAVYPKDLAHTKATGWQQSTGRDTMFLCGKKINFPKVLSKQSPLHTDRISQGLSLHLLNFFSFFSAKTYGWKQSSKGVCVGWNKHQENGTINLTSCGLKVSHQEGSRLQPSYLGFVCWWHADCVQGYLCLGFTSSQLWYEVFRLCKSYSDDEKVETAKIPCALTVGSLMYAMVCIVYKVRHCTCSWSC